MSQRVYTQLPNKKSTKWSSYEIVSFIVTSIFTIIALYFASISYTLQRQQSKQKQQIVDMDSLLRLQKKTIENIENEIVELKSMKEEQRKTNQLEDSSYRKMISLIDEVEKRGYEYTLTTSGRMIFIPSETIIDNTTLKNTPINITFQNQGTRRCTIQKIETFIIQINDPLQTLYHNTYDIPSKYIYPNAPTTFLIYHPKLLYNEKLLVRIIAYFKDELQNKIISTGDDDIFLLQKNNQIYENIFLSVENMNLFKSKLPK